MSELSFPEGWTQLSAIEISDFIGRGVGPSYIDSESKTFAINQKCIRNGKVNLEFARFHSDENDVRNNALLISGDVCINSTGDGTIGRVGLWLNKSDTYRYFVDSHVTIFRPKIAIVDSKYLCELLMSEALQNDLERFCFTGSTNQIELSRSELLKLAFIFPPLHQQQKIAKILTTIDNLIEQTQALIDKYTAIKQGMMADLFTRGIDLIGTPETNPNHGQLRLSFEAAPELYKETELGWVPREWEVGTINDYLSQLIDYRGKTPIKTSEGIPLITAKNVRMGYVDPLPMEYIAFDN